MPTHTLSWQKHSFLSLKLIKMRNNGKEYLFGMNQLLGKSRVEFQKRALAAAMALAFSPFAVANLGEARLESGIGQALRVQVPTVGVAAEDLESRCFRLFRPSSGDGIPFPNDARIDFEETGNVRKLLVRSKTAIQEPVIKFGVEWMCGSSIRRDYTLLLDPVALADPMPIAAPLVMQATPIAPPAAIQNIAPARTARGSVLVDLDGNPVARPRAVRKAKPADGNLPMAVVIPRMRESGARLAIRSGVDGLARDLDLTALAAPRLRLSSSLTMGGTGATASDVDRAVIANMRNRLLSAPIESDLRPQLEVELMIAQKRIGELQARLNAADPSGKATVSTVGAAPGGVGLPSVSGTAGGSSASMSPIASPTVATASAASGTAASATPAQPSALPATPNAAAAKAAISREKNPTDGSIWNQVLRWAWAPAGLLVAVLGGAFYWLSRKRKQESQERAYAAAAAAVGLSPDLVDQAAGGFVDTRMRAMGSIIKGATKGRGPQSSGALATIRNDKAPDTLPQRRYEPGDGMTTIKAPSGHPSAMDLSAELFQPNFDPDKLGVSMVSAITEEASVYVELGRPEEAIAVLKDHIDLERAYSRSTPAPWLMLLDLHHRADDRPAFEALRAEFMNNFNGRIPEWGAFDDINADKSLMEHEHIVERLVRYWSTPKCHEYITKLLYDHRDNSRIGFSLTAYRELVLLDTVHSAAFPPIEQVGVTIPDD